MKPLDRVLCITAALWGIDQCIFAVRAASAPMGLLPGRTLPVGIRCLSPALQPPRSSPGVTAGARTATMRSTRRWLQCVWRDHPALVLLLAYMPAVVLAVVALLVAVLLGHALLH